MKIDNIHADTIKKVDALVITQAQNGGFIVTLRDYRASTETTVGAYTDANDLLEDLGAFLS